MENLQYVQKKMTMSFNRKYTSDVTYSFLFLQTYIIYKYRQYKTSLHTHSSHSVTANTKQSLHIYENHSVGLQYKTVLNTYNMSTFKVKRQGCTIRNTSVKFDLFSVCTVFDTSIILLEQIYQDDSINAFRCLIYTVRYHLSFTYRSHYC